MKWRQIAYAGLLMGFFCSGLAQDAPSDSDSAARENLEPAVDTSAPVASPKKSDEPEGKPSARESVPAASSAQGGARVGKASDHLELDSTQITGNRELPKVLYIVPWKRSDLGDLLGKPVNSLLDEVLQPVDRDVFKRENRYYRALQPDTAAPPAPARSE